MKLIKNKLLNKLFVVAFLSLCFAFASSASTDPTDIIDSATGQYGAAVAVFIAAAVIGAAILFIRKGLRGRM